MKEITLKAKYLSSIYQEHVSALYSYGCKFTADSDLVKDCIHDVFVRLGERRNDAAEIRNMRMFLLMSLKNRLNDELSRKTTESLDSLPFDFAHETVPSGEDIYIEEDRQLRLKKAVSDALQTLGNRQREVVYLYYFEEFSYDEISKMLGLSKQVLRNTVYRALVLLRERLGEGAVALLYWFHAMMIPR